MGLRVMVVDNAAFARAHLRKLFEDHGHEVVAEAANSSEAVAGYAKLRPDLVTLDLVLENEHGFDILEKLQKIDPKVRVVIVSAMVDQNTIERASLLGVSGYITKPEDWPQIEEAISKTI